MVVKQSGKYVVKSHDGSKVLGSYATESEANERLRQIEAAKAARHDGDARVTRIDVGELQPPQRLDNGFLRVDGFITRTGVFPYRDAKSPGGVRREFRPPEEVFHRDSLASLAMMPVTDDHPPVMLTAENASEYQRGSLSESARRDGDKVAAALMVTDAGLIAKMDADEARECSAGYTCELEMRSGRTDAGEPYDAIQRTIRYNHVAVLPRGRAGGDVRVRMDAANLAVILNCESTAETAGPSRGAHVFKTRIDGVEVQFDSEAAYQLFLRGRKDADDALVVKLDTAAKTATTEKARADGLQAKLDSAEQTIAQLKKDAAELPAKLRAESTARLQLEGKAHKALGKTTKLDGLTDKALREKVLAKLVPELKLDGKPEAYVEARFDAEIERLDASADDEDEEDPKNKNDRADEAERNDGDERGDGEERLDADEARAALVKASAGRWKKPATGSSTLEGDRLQVHR